MVVSGDADLPLHPVQPTPEDLRRIGARGGRAYGRNRRNLRAQGHRPLTAVERPVPPLETTAEAIASLDAQFFWLRGAGEPISRRRWRPSWILHAMIGKASVSGIFAAARISPGFRAPLRFTSFRLCSLGDPGRRRRQSWIVTW